MNLTPPDRQALADYAVAIRAHLDRANRALFDVGDVLIEVKKSYPHGAFTRWLETEFDWSERTAQRFISVSKRFPVEVRAETGTIGTTALYLLAAASTPDHVVDAALQKASEGETVSAKDVREMIEPLPSENPFASSNAVEPSEVLPPEEEVGGGLEVQEVETKPRAPEGVPAAAAENPKQERYSPERIVDAARAHLGGFDLDPASSPLANVTIKAAGIFTIDDDGLAQDWGAEGKPSRVWMNPPYRQGAGGEKDWLAKLDEEFEYGHVLEGWALLNHDPSRVWFAPVSKKWPYCEIVGREEFSSPFGLDSGGNRFANVIVYVGRDVEGFVRHASQFGRVIVPPAAMGDARGLVVPPGGDLPVFAPRETESRDLFGAVER